MVIQFVLLTSGLLLLEMFFWVKPFNLITKKIKLRFGKLNPLFQYILPYPYILRIAWIIIWYVLTHDYQAFNIPSIVGDFRSFIISFLTGTIFTLSATYWMLRSAKLSWKECFSIVKKDASDNLGLYLIKSPIYIFLWGGVVEEFIFRGLYIELLSPSLQWWSIFIGGAINLICHTPIWIIYAKNQEKYGEIVRTKHPFRWTIRQILQVAPFTVILGFIYYLTGSLIGPIVMHFGADYVTRIVSHKRTTPDQ